MPVLAKMLDSVSNWGKRGPNTSHAAARTSFCKNTLGGTDVASETRAAAGIAYRSWVFVIRRRNIRPEELFRRQREMVRRTGHLKLKLTNPSYGRDRAFDSRRNCGLF